VFTGGGTAGHVTPNIALFPTFKKMGYDIHYIGSYEGIEKKLIEDYRIPYYGIATGKLRRYFDIKNFSDPFRVLKGHHEAKKILKTLKPDVVFSKGGFVSVPVVRAAASLKIPCVIHESDMTPGLANKLCIPVATKICCTFPETLQQLPADKAILTGSPIRTELLHGNRLKGMEVCGFNTSKPVIMVIGGSQGAAGINTLVRDALPRLLEDFQVVHVCGKDKIDNLLLTKKGYKQFEYVKDELKDLFAMADIVISRAGANAICELLALKKPNLLIPLPASASRGDQILNAKSFEAQGFSMVADEDYLTGVTLTEKVHELYFTRSGYIEAMHNSKIKDSIESIAAIVDGVVK
jgi:UDP-N-acetylglucosamine--N-acetylmuramyl-(pentapeptide) pyrophosphoryl-undecaprenol N-acetylglucosamine transferase